MKPRFEYGEEVRVIRNVRNDGTYPGEDTGRLLLRRGSVGVVQDVGTYLQDQLIYRVHFLDESKVVGCREEELVPADAPWIPNKFEFRDKVTSIGQLSVQGEVIASEDMEGEIVKVIKDDEKQSVSYHVRFNGRTFQIPEDCLQAMAS